MAQVHLYYDRKLDEIVEAWADSLTPNNEDFVFVDGEEGDFGVIRFFGKDLDGNENVHMITQYIRGGDVEQSYYTLAGADIVQKIMRENFETVLRRELEENLDPGHDGGMSVGFVKAFEDATKKMVEIGKEVHAELHVRWVEGFPEYIEDRQIFKFGFKLFESYVLSPPGKPAQISFRNLVDPREFIAIKLRGKLEGKVATMINQRGWQQCFTDSMICVVRVKEEHLDYSATACLPLSDVEVVG
jgi:hypothetical protein